MEPGGASSASDASTGPTFQAATSQTEMELLRQQLAAMKMGLAEEARKRMEAEEKQKEEARKRMEEARKRMEAEEKQKEEARKRIEAEDEVRKRDEAARLPKFDVTDERLFDYLAEKGLLRDVHEGPNEFFVADPDTPLLNREKTFESIFSAFWTVYTAPNDKQPIAAVTGGPGSGKTRMLNTIMQVINTGSLESVAGLNFLPEQGQRVQGVLNRLVGEKALAVGITFNRDTPALTGETDEDRAVALRLFDACFMHSGHLNLLNGLVSGHPTPRAVIQLIRKRYGDGRTPDFPIILCADELRKYVQKNTPEETDFGSDDFKKVVDRLLKALTSTIESRVILLVSSLSASMLNSWKTPGSERSIWRAELLPLRPQDIRELQLVKEATERFKDIRFRAKVWQAFDDAQGSPRFVIELSKLFQLLSPDAADPNFQSLLLSDVLRNLSSFSDFCEQLSLPEMRQSLVAAVLGNLVDLKDYDSAVSTGILLMIEENCFSGSFQPVMPPLLMWLLAQRNVVVAANNGMVVENEEKAVDVVAARILILAKEFTGFDYSLSPGKAFEGQFAYMLQMRALALFVRSTKRPLRVKYRTMPVETFETSLAELLNVTKPFLHTGAALALLQSALILPAILEQVTLSAADFAASTLNRSTTGPLARIVLASDDQNPGWDVALQVRRATVTTDDIVVLFQNRWSKQQAETQTGKGDIANDIVNTVKYHPYLHASINEGRTVLVHLAYRHVATPDDPYQKAILDAVTAATYSKKKKTDGSTVLEPKLTSAEFAVAQKLCHTSMVINKANLQQLLGPSFRNRPAFRETLP